MLLLGLCCYLAHLAVRDVIQRRKVASKHSVYVTYCDTLAILFILLLQSFDLEDVFILLFDKVVHVNLR